VQQLWDETTYIAKTKDMQEVCQKPLQCGPEVTKRAFAHQIAFNALAQIGGFQEDDFTSEEWKMVLETQKIFHTKKIKISATCVRVPVLNAHSEAVYLETIRPIEPRAVKQLLKKAKGVVLVDDPQQSKYPMPAEASGRDEVFVGRVRRDPFVKNGMWLWIVSDNLRKGAATNAVQIAEYLIGTYR
jgi:aspartate-semialdehyde dehydrogenase